MVTLTYEKTAVWFKKQTLVRGVIEKKKGLGHTGCVMKIADDTCTIQFTQLLPIKEKQGKTKDSEEG